MTKKTQKELCKLGQDYMVEHEQSENYTASFCGVSASGAISDAGLRSPCHANLKRIGNSAVIVTWVRRVREKAYWEDQVRWLGWLINDSVFKDMYITKDPQEALSRGLCVSGDQPQNLVAAACIATRLCFEKPSLIGVQDKLVAQGVDPDLAFAITGRVGKLEETDHGLSLSFTFQSDHHTFSGYGFSKAALKNLLSKTFGGSVGPIFREQGGYSGVTKIWGKTNSSGSCALNSLLKKCIEDKNVVLNSAKGKNPNPWSSRPNTRRVSLFHVEDFNKEVAKCR